MRDLKKNVSFEGFLKERKIYEHAYSADDLKQDEETLRLCGYSAGP